MLTTTVPESDKHYWHRYTDEYERLVLSSLKPQRIIEIGVFEGGSIAAFSARFPAAEIIGVDILPVQSGWPTSDKIRYFRMDQADRDSVAAMFRSAGICNLVLEDGSHIPEHQVTSLVEGWPWVSSGGWYILEDLHTSHPGNVPWKHHTPAGYANALNVLLAIEHLKSTNSEMTLRIAQSLAGFFTVDEIIGLFKTVSRIYMYRRALLPLKCYKCHKSDFDFLTLRCRCGVELYNDPDSITCMLQKI